MRILVVEDDLILGDGLTSGLRKHNYTVDWVKDGKSALQAILNEKFEVIILDLGLPIQSGIEVLKTMRAKNINTPVLILTALEEIENRVLGLDAGADDYLTKPFDLEELCARIRALQRRGTSGSGDPIVKFKDITIDPASRAVHKEGVKVEISRREFVLLYLLLSNLGKIVSRENLTKTLYGWDEDVDSNALEVHIHNLRKKFGNDLITTVRGVGYMVEKDTN
jgi:two-component system, OmpR family, response regulator QseB